MTLIAAVSTTGTICGVTTFVAVIDPAIQNIALAVVSAAVAITTAVYTFRTARLNALQKKVEAQDVKIAEVIKTSDGMKDALVDITRKAGLAEGELKGMTDAKAVADALALGAAQSRLPPAVSAPHGEPVMLKKIEKNTAATAANTAATDETVQEIKDNTPKTP